MPDAAKTTALIAQAQAGDSRALGQLLMQHRDRLLQVAGFRIDARIRGRVDAADVVQETFVTATARFAEYARDPRMPFFLWLRFLAIQKLCELHRHHLSAKARNAARDVSLYRGPEPQATSAVLAVQLLGKYTSPSQAVIRDEVRCRVEETLNAMNRLDREILALRHFEQLTNAEAAEVLHLSESAASTRYVRALKRLRSAMEEIADFAR